jgi:hypothetical protein
VVDVAERVHDQRPWVLYLRRERGPAHQWERTEGIVHIAVQRHPALEVIGEAYPVCSCHGHPWPCRQLCEDRQVAAELRELETRLARAVPGVCAACGEPVTARQRSVVFPGDNLLVPGAPPPTFHLRQACRPQAQEYELQRLAADPTVLRLCTCPGIAFEHHGLGETRGPLDCTAGPACTGHHYGHAAWCGTALTTVEHGQVRPPHRCTQPRCQGALG